MLPFLQRIVVVQDKSGMGFKLKEKFLYSPDGCYGDVIEVDANSSRQFAASRFLQHNYDSSRPSEIIVFFGERRLSRPLISQVFLRYVKVIFDIDRDGLAVVRGIPPRPTDVCRLWGFGLLGRDYEGRKDVVILSCKLAPESRS